MCIYIYIYVCVYMCVSEGKRVILRVNGRTFKGGVPRRQST